MTTPKEPSYRIVHLKASNVQCLTAEGVEIVPNRNTIVISGKNAAGKSSILNSILWTLGGSKELPEQPIRRGANRLDTMLDMGEFVASLKITQSSGAKLTLKSKDGQDIRQPATLLQKYSNEILLDLVGFMRKGETPEGRRKQADILKQLVGLDFTKLDADKARNYEERKAKNRDLDTARGKLANYPFDPTAPATEVSIKDLSAQLTSVQQEGQKALQGLEDTNKAHIQTARLHNEANDKIRSQRDGCVKSLAATQTELSAIELDIKNLEEQLAKYKDRRSQLNILVLKNVEAASEANRHVANLLDLDLDAIETEYRHSRESIQKGILDVVLPIQERINLADDTNTKVRGNRRRKEIETEIRTLEDEVDTYTKAIESIELRKQTDLAASKFPLEGLSFDETGILLNGLPLNQGSQAQQIKAVLAIGLALKPKIRVCLIRDGSLLDEESLKEVEAMMDANDGQAWVEVVNSSSATAIVIEDGAIKE